MQTLAPHHQEVAGHGRVGIPCSHGAPPCLGQTRETCCARGRSGQPGEITRIAGCASEELLQRPVFWLMPTWVTGGVTSHGDDK